MTSLNMTIEVTNKVSVEDIPDVVAETCQEAYDALAKLPTTRMVSIDFGPEDYAGPAKIDGTDATDAQKSAWNARRFVRQGTAWAQNTEVTVPVTDKDGTVTGERTSALSFRRMGDVKGNPKRVSFRIYMPRPAKTETPAT